MAHRPLSSKEATISFDAPPPSTLAAQIVHNQSRPKVATTENGDSATFAQLLDEILHNPAAIQETDVQINVKLINVVAEAGLARLTDASPLEWDNSLRLAIDSVHVIETTIKRQPDIVFLPIVENGPELLLVLLTRLITICGRPKCQTVPAMDVLHSLVTSLEASPATWPMARRVRQIYADVVDEVLYELESSIDKIAWTVSVPPAVVVARLYPDAQQEIALAQTCQTSLTDKSHAFIVCLDLLELADKRSAWKAEAERRLVNLVREIKKDLDLQGRFDEAVGKLLLISKSLPLMTSLFEDIIHGDSHHTLQPVIGKTLRASLDVSHPAAVRTLSRLLRSLVSSHVFGTLETGLQNAISLWLAQSAQKRKYRKSATLGTTLRIMEGVTEFTAHDPIHEVGPAVTSIQGKKRKGRQRNIANHDTEEIEDASFDASKTKESQVKECLGLIGSDDLATLPASLGETYAQMNDEEQCRLWTLIEELASDSLDFTTQLALALVDLPVRQQDRTPRVLSMVAIKAIVEKTSDEGLLDLTSSRLGQICLSSLHSSIRELRIAASQTLPPFLREDLPDKLRHDNRRIVMEYLRILSDRDQLNEHETLIATWAKVGLCCGHQELHLVLLRLIEYLGHRNSLVSSLAYSELVQMASLQKVNIDDLFAPFWSTIAVAVVQDLPTRPQKIQHVCDLLQCDVSQFLSQTQRYTIPILILTKKMDVLQKIAATREGSTTISEICLLPKVNFAAAAAYLLMQPVADAETLLFSSLAEVIQEMPEADLIGKVKSEAVLIASDILQAVGKSSAEKRSRSLRALQILANISVRKPGTASKSMAKSSRNMAIFLEGHILGILTHFSSILENNSDVKASVHEKIECVQGIEEMLQLIQNMAIVALPQLRACLQSAMEQPELSRVAFSAWMAMLSALDNEDVVLIVDQTFVLVAKYWDQLSVTLQSLAHEKISELLRDNHQRIQEQVLTIPSLHHIPLMSKIASQIDSIKKRDTVDNNCMAFVKRLRDENELVARQALKEVVPFLEEMQDHLHDGATSEQAPVYLSELIRALLDGAVQVTGADEVASDLYGKALGIIGCVDPNRVEATRKSRQVLLLSNFDRANEVVDWVAALFEDVLVKAFKSVNNAKSQGFLAYVMQELIKFCNFNHETASLRTRMGSQTQNANQRWHAMPEHIRISLMPFLSSRYVLTNSLAANETEREYPGFDPKTPHAIWLRSLVYDLVWKAKGENGKMVFPLLARIVRGHDIAIATFLLPYITLNIVLGGTVGEIKDITDEMLAVLKCQGNDAAELDNIQQSSESLFATLDYMSTWLQEKKKTLGENRAAAYKGAQSSVEFDEIKDVAQIEEMEKFLALIPAEATANRALACGAYSRALFHWEQFIRQQRSLIPTPPLKPEDEKLYETLHEIYAQIDEPDGLDGIGAHLSFLSEEQRIVQHTRAGRWTAAQAWHELKTVEEPGVSKHQLALLTCLRETGQYTSLLRYADSFMANLPRTVEADDLHKSLLPFVAEACWMTSNFDALRVRLDKSSLDQSIDFNVGLGQALLCEEEEAFSRKLSQIRRHVVTGLTMSGTTSLQSCHYELRCLHALYELEMIAACAQGNATSLLAALNKRSGILGSYTQDRQLILGLKRAAMARNSEAFTAEQLAPLWIETAKFARKANNTRGAYNAVLHARDYADRNVKLEEARLLWHDGHQRQAIQNLAAAIEANLFGGPEDGPVDAAETSTVRGTRQSTLSRNVLAARAHLLRAKWLDASGQVQTKDMTARYQTAVNHFQRWEKGHYYLGKHYNKLLEAERALPREKQSAALLGGELVKLTIENLIRSVPFGNKYWHQTIPKILTLWLDLGADTLTKGRGEDGILYERRSRSLNMINKQLEKYFDRIPSYVWYTALSQIISRITHPHAEVWKQLCAVLVKIVAIHPSQALWSIFAVVKSSDSTRIARGEEVLNRSRDIKSKLRTEVPTLDVRSMIQHGQRLTEGLLQACEHPIEPRKANVGLNRDLGFNHKLAPCALVVPIERTLSIHLPAGADGNKIRLYKAFAQEKITIASFTEDVLVLSSLQRPRKITIRGSDGKMYGLLCKPKDDLRKDQRLMEFNGIINRALKRDPESSKRRLYIKTYAVMPLSEESGTIEWVEGIKPLRDILLHIYARKGIRPNYNEIRATLNEACKSPEHAHLFTTRVLDQFPASLHEWFREIYTEPDTWFASRLRYARSAAVTSMTGHVLGLGDRHGENILLEESTGGVFHVDFNCLFDKGLTFEKPELVPFRLTHNMVDAMGPYGYEGPFRRSSEITMGLLRQNKETLMTVLETFLYDPTTDFVGKKKRAVRDVPETPKEILESVERKLKGLLRDETVPLSTEGYVDALIREAVSPFNLASMYIGWCSFL